jgi:hypothetical protein
MAGSFHTLRNIAFIGRSTAMDRGKRMGHVSDPFDAACDAIFTFPNSISCRPINYELHRRGSKGQNPILMHFSTRRGREAIQEWPW